MMATDPLVEEMSAAARVTYCRLMREFLKRFRGLETDYGAKEMPTWDGGQRAHDGRRCQAVWPKIGKFVLANQLNLERLMQLLFRLAQGGNPPTPNQCHGHKALALYHKYAEQEASRRSTECRVKLACEAATVKREIVLRTAARALLGWSDAQVIRSVISDHSLSLSPLLRYCLAWREGYDDLAEKYKTAAQVQYLSDPQLYEEAWGTAIPNDLRRALDDAAN